MFRSFSSPFSKQQNLSLARKSSCNGDKEARQLSLIYSKRECSCESWFNIASAIALVVVVCGNVVVKTNEYRLPINFYITFLPFDDSFINWTWNYLFQAVTMSLAAFVFFGYLSLNLEILSHSCWGIDMVKLLIEKLHRIVGDDETSFNEPQEENIAKQVKAIHEMHLKVLEWNAKVVKVTQVNFLIEFAIFSMLVCLCIFTIAENPFDSAYILLLLIVLLTQLFVYCWMGHRVIVRIDELSAAFYEIKWYSLDINHSKAIAMMLRASHNMHGFHGIFKPLSMETFQQVGACDFLLNEVIFLISLCFRSVSLNANIVSIGFGVFLFASHTAEDDELRRWRGEIFHLKGKNSNYARNKSLKLENY
jgi:7tm Odorant receptor